MADLSTSPTADGTAEATHISAANESATTALPTHKGNALTPANETKPSDKTPVNTLKRPRSAEPVTQFLNPNGTGASSLESTESPISPLSTLTVHGSHSCAKETPVPPRQVRTEGSGGSPLTPRSPYSNLPRKVPRKTPVSTPGSSVGTPPTLSTPPTGVHSGAAKLAVLHQRWAKLLQAALMKEREPHEAETVMALSLRIVEALPGNLEETKDGFQTLLYGMKDEKNGELRRKVVEGELLVERLVQMDDRELANPEVRKKIEARMEDRAKDTNLSELAKAMRTSNSTLFKCKSCGARDTSWYQRQTRSGDEPMTVIITCNRCNTQWRQY